MTADECNELWSQMQEAMANSHAPSFLKAQHEARFRSAYAAGDFDGLRRLVDLAPELERQENRSRAGNGALRTPQLAVAAAEKDGRKLSVDADTGAIVVHGGTIPEEYVVLALEYHAKAVVAFLNDRNAARVVVPARLCR